VGQPVRFRQIVRPGGHDAGNITGRITANGVVMGYICPDRGEGLPEDTPCPYTMAGGDLGD